MPNKTAKVPPPKPPPAAPRRRSPWPLVGIIAVLAIVGGFYWYERSAAPAPSERPDAPAAASQQVQPAKGPLQLPAAAAGSDEPPASAKFGPHKQDAYPPLPDTGFPPPRPADTVRAVYQFAAEHPEVLSYIPCYCGCDRQGHKGNDDCFVAQRDGKGDVTAWDSHGMT